MAYTKTNWTTSTPINPTNLNHIEDGIADLYNAIFPVGQIVIKGDNKDYSNWLGFTWERTAVGKVLVGIDSNDSDFNNIGKTGGEKTHTLTVAEMPSHEHALSYSAVSVKNGGPISGLGGGGYWAEGIDTSNTITSTGGNQAHNNLQPYQVVAYWKRIA